MQAKISLLESVDRPDRTSAANAALLDKRASGLAFRAIQEFVFFASAIGIGGAIRADALYHILFCVGNFGHKLKVKN